MNILLAAINAKYIHSNLAVYSLKAYAKEYLIEELDETSISIAEYTINQQVDDILQDLYKRQPDMLCLSCYIWNLAYVEEIAQEIKKIMPDLILWIGGPEVSYDGVDVLRRLPMVDGVMKGEGEQTFCELIAHYYRRNELADIQGIVYRDGNEIIEMPWRPVMDLSKVPFVYDDLSKFEHKIIYYESSRGCPFSCSYCLSSIDKCLRFRSLDLVKKELQHFIDHKIPQVKFVDRTFNCKHDHAMAIWQYIKDHDNGITNFHFEVSADLLNEQELELMRTMRPGLIQLEIGVQSTNPKTIKEIKRTMAFETLAGIVKKINSFENIHQHLDLIAGLPYEDYESFADSFDQVYELAPEQLQLGFLKVLKGSYMEEQKAAYDLIYKSRPPYEVLSTKWLPYKDVLRLKGVEEMVEVYYNSRQFCYTLPYLIQRFERPFAFFEALAEYYEANDLHMVNHSRTTRYEILLRFASEHDPSRAEAYKELLTFDFYLRENAKNRPDFAGEAQLEKEFERDFYDKEETDRTYLKGYEGFDKRKLRKMTHIEKFSYQVAGNMEKESCRILFDYKNRSPLNHQAMFVVV